MTGDRIIDNNGARLPADPQRGFPKASSMKEAAGNGSRRIIGRVLEVGAAALLLAAAILHPKGGQCRA
jgi:hypothetical protein